MAVLGTEPRVSVSSRRGNVLYLTDHWLKLSFYNALADNAVEKEWKPFQNRRLFAAPSPKVKCCPGSVYEQDQLPWSRAVSSPAEPEGSGM